MPAQPGDDPRLRAIVSTAVDGIITIDDKGIIETVNPAVEKLFGYVAEELVGHNIKILMPLPYRHEHDGYLHNYVTTGEKKIIGIGREVVGMRKDGTTFPMDLAVSQFWLGEKRMFAGIIRDITERKDAEEALKAAKLLAVAAKEAAEAANKAKDQFMAILSHELRTPLTPVLATMTYVEAMQDLPAELREEIGTIRRNIEIEARLIDDLLDLTRISRGKIELHLEVLDAHAALRTALETCQSDIEAKGLEVSLALHAREHHIWADPARMQQVFWNLIKNAVKFTPAGGFITLCTSNEKRRLRVAIIDTGIGIDAETLPRIFNAFEQGERTVTRLFGGLGLGLSIAKALVGMHRGRLTAASAGKDKGATFTVELEAVPATTVGQPATAAGSTPAVPMAPAARACKRILLVEDHEDTLRIMAKLLEGYGYKVRTAATVQKAMELAAAETFDLLISDLGLPDGSGLDIIRHVKDRYNVKGIALSGFGSDEDLRRSRDAGFEHHLIKPVSFQTLEGTIRKVAE